MLKIYFGEMEEAVYNTSLYFDNTFLDSWFEDSFAQKMIKDIDKAVVVGPQAVDSKILGVISVRQLSGGLKTLLLVYNNHERVFNASTCGNNCAKWLLRIAKNSKEDVVINLRHLMDFGDKPFEICIVNTGVIVHNMAEMVENAGLLI